MQCAEQGPLTCMIISNKEHQLKDINAKGGLLSVEILKKLRSFTFREQINNQKAL